MDNKEEQIEKIAKDLCSKYKICTCNDRNGRCQTPQQQAKIIYELGYRRQKEGEWIRPRPFLPAYCSQCLSEQTIRGMLPTYCPDCGARMNGGNN